MNCFRCYITPFDDDGNYTAEVEVTKHVDWNALGSLASSLDNTEFDIGVFRSSALKLTLKNATGLFSEVGQEKSIFRYKRGDSKVRLTWSINEQEPVCGILICGDGSTIGEEITLFEGLLKDDDLAMDLDAQKIAFSVLGYESRFQQVIVPFGSISAGNLFSAVIYALLNQPEITNLLTVSPANISCGIDLAIDSITGLQNKTVQEGLNKLLLHSNSVIRVENGVVKVSPRTADAAVSFNFYGQASAIGPESIQNIKGIKSGVARIFNYLTWKDSTIAVTDPTSIELYGVRKREFDWECVTNDAKRQQILEAVREEFKDPKREFEVYTPINYASMALTLLGRVDFDYPLVYVPGDTEFPICGAAICGEAVMPEAQWSFELTQDENFKVMSRSVEIKNCLMRFRVRGV